MGEFEQFHSAVNRIPVLRQPSQEMADKGLLPKDLFSDGPATGHDHLAANRWSGSIDLEMTVRTPLVFGEQKDGEITLPVRDGELVVPPTMVKGMISRAFEILTCSRFRVFGAVENTSGLRGSKNDHSRRLTYRADPAAANNLFPGRVCTTPDGNLAVEILDGKGSQFRSALIRDDVRKGPGKILTEGHPGIPSGRQDTTKRVLQRFRNLTPHGQWTKVRITEWTEEQEEQPRQGKKKGRSPNHFMVTGVWRGRKLEKFFSITGKNKNIHDVWGYPCRTSPDSKTSGDLRSDKKYKRFIFFTKNENNEPLKGSIFPLNASHLAGHAGIINAYREQRKISSRNKHLPSRIAESPSDSLTEGDLVFVQLSSKSIPSQPTTLSTEYVVNVFPPTMIDRRPYNRSPRELATAQNVLPATNRTETSAADRVFGYVIPETKEGTVGGDVASQGHLSFGVVDTSEARISKSPKQLAPLLSPKPSSARRFLTDNDTGTTLTKSDHPLARHELFSDGQNLGSAAYPVHRKLLNRKDFPKAAITSGQSAGLDHSNEAVRMTARSWVKVGSVLRCTMRFTNLSREELGALIWVLTPENLVPASEKQKDPRAIGFLRMGMGKPFGLGVVETRIAENGLRIVKNEGLASGYVNLTGCLGTETSPVEIAEFSLPSSNNLPKTPWVKALQRASFGYSDGIEVRYMTLDENKENNKSDSKTGKPKDKRGLSPADLTANTPAPIVIPRPSKQRRRNNSR